MISIDDVLYSGLLLAWHQDPVTKQWRGPCRFNRDDLKFGQWMDSSLMEPLVVYELPID